MLDLSTREGLQFACEEAERTQANPEWREEIYQLLKYVKEASPKERESEEFHRKIWNENPISTIGHWETANVNPAITELNVRKKLSDALIKSLPDNRQKRIDFLNEIRNYLINYLLQKTQTRPWAKTTRMLAALFPTEFTTLIVDGGRNAYTRTLLKRMRIKATRISFIGKHRLVIDRLDEVLGPVPDGDLYDLAGRMMLPMILIELTDQEHQERIEQIPITLGEVNRLSNINEKNAPIMRPINTQNIILYGPPGTGKTYDTKRQALNLLMGKDSVNAITQEDIAEKFRKYQEKGQLEFVTFHQSYGYEDFIEGLRPILDDTVNKDVRYEMHHGIFKRIALRAASEGLSKITNELDFEYLWALLVEDIRENEDIIVQSKSGTEYVLRLSGQNNVETLRCEKNVEGDYKILETKLFASKKNSKKVWENFNGDPNDFTSKKSNDIFKVGHHYTALWVIYKKLFELNREKNISDSPQIDNVAREAKARVALDQDNFSFTFFSDSQQYVLIIDEINRGNISKILGELMTLLEPDKRLGAANELRLPLAYSPESRFGVPPNLHILGTMNTADRSIALMDVALRRRFTFKEVMPDMDCLQEVLTEELGDGSPLVTLIVDLFEILNKRIRFLYDRDHQIGHAYFLGVKTLEDLRLVFADRVIPLLQEYFYDDWNKICIVLGCPYGDNGKPKRKASHLNGDRTYRAPIIEAHRFSEKDTLGFDHEDYEDRVDFNIMSHFQSGPMEKNDLARTFLGVLQLEEKVFEGRLKELTAGEASPDREDDESEEETTTDAS